MTRALPSVRVIGIGNVLMGDDAVGPWAVRLLAATYLLRDEVSVEDLGTPGLDLTVFVAGLDAVILVDAVRAGGEPGELRRYDREAILGKRPGLALCQHEPRLCEALLACELQNAAPRDVLLLGIIPGRVDCGARLSDAVRRSLPRTVNAVASELALLGFPLARRDPPLAPDIWWER